MHGVLDMEPVKSTALDQLEEEDDTWRDDPMSKGQALFLRNIVGRNISQLDQLLNGLELSEHPERVLILSSITGKSKDKCINASKGQASDLIDELLVREDELKRRTNGYRKGANLHQSIADIDKKLDEEAELEALQDIEPLQPKEAMWKLIKLISACALLGIFISLFFQS